MKIIRSKRYLDVSKKTLPNELEASFRQYFPSYLCQPTTFRCSWAKSAWLALVQWLLSTVVQVVLRPRRGIVGNLDPAEVDEVYCREAATYDRKHHLTTRGQDTMWRRFAGWQVAALAASRSEPLMVLDLCTGTGLTVVEMANILSNHSVAAKFVGLDRSEAMLQRAHRCCLGRGSITTEFARGDATSLVNTESTDDGFARFAPGTFDSVVQVFGIGGISEPLSVFENVLTVLKENGRFVLVDMHAPIPNQPGEWPLLLKWLHTPVLETVTYHQSTIPLVLKRLWGWRDPTLDFYLLPLVTWHDTAEGSWWGFETISRTVESERWWLSLPIMPVARMVVRKVQLSKPAAVQRQSLLALALAARVEH